MKRVRCPHASGGASRSLAIRNREPVRSISPLWKLRAKKNETKLSIYQLLWWEFRGLLWSLVNQDDPPPNRAMWWIKGRGSTRNSAIGSIHCWLLWIYIWTPLSRLVSTLQLNLKRIDADFISDDRTRSRSPTRDDLCASTMVSALGSSITSTSMYHGPGMCFRFIRCSWLFLRHIEHSILCNLNLATMVHDRFTYYISQETSMHKHWCVWWFLSN